MEYGQVQESKYNPKNRFLFCCCHSNEVDKGWGFGCQRSGYCERRQIYELSCAFFCFG